MDKDEKKQEAEITEAMIEAGDLAFSRWIESEDDEGVVETHPSFPSMRLLLSDIFRSMMAEYP